MSFPWTTNQFASTPPQTAWIATNILALLTVIGGILSFLYSASRDRDLKTAEHADKVRTAAAQLLGKTNALRNVAPTAVALATLKIVDTKVKLITTYKPVLEMHAMWGTMTQLESDAKAKVFDLQTSSAYLDFYTFNPDTKRCMDAAIKVVADVLTETYVTEKSAVEAYQDYPPRRADYSVTELYNELIDPFNALLTDTRIDGVLRAIEAHLLAVIARKDDVLSQDGLQTEKVNCAGEVGKS